MLSYSGGVGTQALTHAGTWALGHLGTWALGHLGTWALGHHKIVTHKKARLMPGLSFLGFGSTVSPTREDRNGVTR